VNEAARWAGKRVPTIALSCFHSLRQRLVAYPAFSCSALRHFVAPPTAPDHRSPLQLPNARSNSMLRTLILCLSSVLALSTSLQAQVASVGERVRITTPSQRGSYRYVGRVSDVSRDSLTVQSPDVGTRSVAIADITALDVSTGVRGNGRRGMLYGSLIGLGAGAVLGAATYKKPDCNGSYFCPNGPAIDITAGALVGGVVGFAVGGLWGASHPSEQWTRRMITRVGIAPIERRPGLMVGARF
jgi:hypothetical protein